MLSTVPVFQIFMTVLREGSEGFDKRVSGELKEATPGVRSDIYLSESEEDTVWTVTLGLVKCVFVWGWPSLICENL